MGRRVGQQRKHSGAPETGGPGDQRRRPAPRATLRPLGHRALPQRGAGHQSDTRQWADNLPAFCQHAPALSSPPAHARGDDRPQEQERRVGVEGPRPQPVPRSTEDTRRSLGSVINTTGNRGWSLDLTLWESGRWRALRSEGRPHSASRRWCSSQRRSPPEARSTERREQVQQNIAVTSETAFALR